MGNNMMNTFGFMNGVGPLIRGGKFVTATSGLVAAPSTVDLYTVPAGKKTLIFNILKVGSSNAITQIKISGTYYTMSGGTIILNAGETYAINVTSASGTTNFWMTGIEMDISSNLHTARNLALSNGDNTLYTVPAGKSAILADPFFGIYTSAQSSGYRNNSGGTRTLKAYIVPNGGSKATTNQIYQSTVTDATTNGAWALSASMNAGDFVVLNIDAGTATQWAWLNYIEL